MGNLKEEMDATLMEVDISREKYILAIREVQDLDIETIDKHKLDELAEKINRLGKEYGLKYHTLPENIKDRHKRFELSYDDSYKLWHR